jgi:prephenate dehydrogenase
MVLLAVPMRAIKPVLESIVDHINDEMVITDAGSAKGAVIKTVEEVFGGTVPHNFVAAHPVAGREKSGVEAAIDDLFMEQKVVLTPTEDTAPHSVAQVKNMWEATGASVVLLDEKQHDEVLAATSHLPHILAYSLVNTLSKSEYGDDVFAFAAGGFKSFSRIASSDPVMWRDICLENKDAILSALNNYQKDLAALTTLIESEDDGALFKLFTHAKATRDRNI